MKESKLVSVLMIIVLVTILTGCGKKSSNVTTDSSTGVTVKEVRIATQPSPFAASIFVAKEKGYLEDELSQYGVKITYTSFAAGPLMNEAFAAGQQDIGIAGDVPLLLAKASGQDRITFAKASSGEKTQAVVVKPYSTITSATDLKGKKVAVVKGSYAHHLLDLVLKGAGLTLKDIELVNLPVADIRNAVAQGQVNAGVIWEPALTKGVTEKQIKLLQDGTGIKENNIFYFASTDFTKKNPAIIEGYIKALVKATAYIQSNPDAAAEAITGDVNLPKEEIVNLLKKYNYTPSISDADIQSLKVVEQFNLDEDLSENSVDVDSFVDTQYLKAAGVMD